jgi:hypothetical protein
MTFSSIAEAWNSAFAPALPAGFLCRKSLHERWLRIHSLPESKRYPETPTDRKELLIRHNSVANYTLGQNSDCVLFITRFGESKEWSAAEYLPLGLSKPQHVMSFDDRGEQRMQFFALRAVWKSQAFDELILAAAEEKISPILFANLATANAYAPYDGGADLFFSSANAVGIARGHFLEWLSKRADGL